MSLTSHLEACYIISNTNIGLDPVNIAFQIQQIHYDVSLYIRGHGLCYMTEWAPTFFTEHQKTHYLDAINNILDYYAIDIQKIHHVLDGILVVWNTTMEPSDGLPPRPMYVYLTTYLCNHYVPHLFLYVQICTVYI